MGDDAGKSLPAHLSDQSSVIQAKFAALLNSFFELIEMLGVSDMRGGCPFGVRLQPQKYQKHERNDAKQEHVFQIHPHDKSVNQRLARGSGGNRLRQNVTTIGRITDNPYLTHSGRFADHSGTT